MKVAVIDPGVFIPNMPKYNLGDLIIQQAVTRELHNVLLEDTVYHRICPHIPMSEQDLKHIDESDMVFLGGSNLIGNTIFLKRKLSFWRQWKINLKEAKRFKNKAVMLGIGWRRYEGSTGFYTRAMLNACLDKSRLHSVRDEYTKIKFNKMGFDNVINTGCPTIWPLADVSKDDIPVKKAENALLMLTNYNLKPEIDGNIIDLLCSNYSKIYFWPQGVNDKEYALSFGRDFEILPESLDGLDQFVHSDIDFDYIGTRLHGGIFCLLANRRSLILKIDNRATELARQTGLPTVDRDDLDGIEDWICNSTETLIHVNNTAISTWRNQFA